MNHEDTLPDKKNCLEEVDKKLLVKNNRTINIATFPIELMLLTLPYKQIDDTFFKRKVKGKNISITINSQNDEGINYGLPFGIYPRTLLYYICSEVRRTRNRHIKLGNSFREIFEKIKINKKNHKISGQQLSNFKDQFLRLFNSTISIKGISKVDDDNRIDRINILLAEGISFWETKNDIDYELTLTESFFNYVINSNATIFDYDLILEFKQSPLLLDLYIYLNYRAHTASFYKKNMYVSFRDLHEQFGTQSTFGEFKRSVKAHLPKLVEKHGKLFIGIAKKDTGDQEDYIIISKESSSNVSQKERYDLPKYEEFDFD